MQFLRVCPDDRRRTDLLAMPTHGVIKCNGMVIERDELDILVVDRKRRYAWSMIHDQFVVGIKARHFAQNTLNPGDNPA